MVVVIYCCFNSAFSVSHSNFLLGTSHLYNGIPGILIVFAKYTYWQKSRGFSVSLWEIIKGIASYLLRVVYNPSFDIEFR